MKRILFLCTGNFYRSRFAEEYFNYHAKRRILDWRADSRGLSERDLSAINKEPMAGEARATLAGLGVEPENAHRFPQSLSAEEVSTYDRVIAVCRAEHEPLIEKNFPALSGTVHYWEIWDVDVEVHETALQKLAAALDSLLSLLEESQELPTEIGEI